MRATGPAQASAETTGSATFPASSGAADTGRPGSRGLLAGRYRLSERLTVPGRPALWRATDEVLGRPVTVCILAAGSRRATRVVAAARAAARLGDPRLARVLDADDRADPPYVVAEWPRGAPLRELVAAGPLPPRHAAAMVAEAARALDAAHQAGVAHLRLGPGSLWCDPDGSVTITGLGTDAVRTRSGAADPVLADTRGLARLLYAALTGRWPGPGGDGIPAAPIQGGRPQCPRQLVPGLPPDIGAISCRALAEDPCCGPPILSTGRLATELTAAAAQAAGPPGTGPAATLRLPPVAAATEPLSVMHDTRDGRAVRAASPAGEPEPERQPAPVRTLRGRVAMRKLRERAPGWKPARGPHSAGPRGRAGRRLGAAAIVAALLGTAGWLLADRPAAPSHRAAAAQIRSLRPVREAAFGPRGEGDGDNPALARLAVGRAAGWHSHWYTTAAFGNLKPGTGLLLDMGHSVTITSAEVRLGSVPGADLQLRLGGMPMLADLLPVARAGNAGGEVRLKLARPARARYVLIWFTRLPPDSAGTFRASVSGVRVYGPG